MIINFRCDTIVEMDDDRSKEQLTPAQQEQERQKEVKERSLRLISALDTENRGSLRAGNERLGWHVGLGEHEVFILTQPVDVPNNVFNEGRQEWDVITHRYYVMLTRHGVRAIRLNKGELSPDGIPMTVERATKTLPMQSEADDEEEMVEVEVDNPDGSPKYVKVPDIMSFDDRYDSGERYLLGCLRRGQEGWEDGHGALKHLGIEEKGQYKSVSYYEFVAENTDDEVIQESNNASLRRVGSIRDKRYSHDFPGFTREENTGRETFEMRGHNSPHYFVVNGYPAHTGIVADIPLGVVESALKKSREKAKERRFISSTDYQKQLDLLDRLEKGSTDEESPTNQ